MGEPFAPEPSGAPVKKINDLQANLAALAAVISGSLPDQDRSGVRICSGAPKVQQLLQQVTHQEKSAMQNKIICMVSAWQTWTVGLAFEVPG
jgi:hypothetical protein